MDKEQREQIDKGIEACKKWERTFRGIRTFLEIAKLGEDIGMLTKQLEALDKEAQKAKATVHDINEARRAMKQ